MPRNQFISLSYTIATCLACTPTCFIFTTAYFTMQPQFHGAAGTCCSMRLARRSLTIAVYNTYNMLLLLSDYDWGAWGG